MSRAPGAMRRERRRLGPAALAVAGVVLLALGAWKWSQGDTSTGATPAEVHRAGTTTSAPPTTAAAPVAPATTPTAAPVALRVPSVGIESAVFRLGLEPDGTLEVPRGEQYDLAGWYEGGPPPGAIGPAVIAGHIDSKSGPSVFYRLREVSPGDEVVVTAADGTEARFVVERVERHAKDDFPTDAVYGPVSRPELRLVTCGGVFDRSTGHYVDNVVVFATLAT